MNAPAAVPRTVLPDVESTARTVPVHTYMYGAEGAASAAYFPQGQQGVREAAQPHQEHSVTAVGVEVFRRLSTNLRDIGSVLKKHEVTVANLTIQMA